MLYWIWKMQSLLLKVHYQKKFKPCHYWIWKIQHFPLNLFIFSQKYIQKCIPKLETPQPILPDKISIVGSIPPIKVICLRISGWQVISFKIFSDPSWHFGSSVSSKFVRISKPPESMIANWTWSFRKSKSCYNLEVAIMENWGFEETLFISSLGIKVGYFQKKISITYLQAVIYRYAVSLS